MVLVFGTALSALAGWQQAKQNQRHLQAELASVAQEIERDLTTRLQVYEYRLRGIRGAIHMVGEREISRAQFERYGQARNVDQEYPGARGFGYIRRVPREREAAFLASARADGKPDFRIQQLMPHDGERFVIQYVEPAERNAQAIGLDIASESNRRLAALAAARTARATLTGPISLVQESGATQRAFLFLLPVYRQTIPPDSPRQRQRDLLGWSYAPLAMSEVMAFLDITAKGLQLTLRDVTGPAAPEKIYTSPVLAGQGVAHTFSMDRPMFGRVWRFEVAAGSTFAQRLDPLQPGFVFLAGCLASLLLAAITSAILLSRQRRQESLASQVRLATIVENSSDAIIGEALDGRIITWNRAAEQMFGYREAEVLGKPLAPLLLPPERLTEDELMLKRAARGERTAAMETQRLHKDGRLIDVAITCSLIREPDGSILGAAKLMHDISDRKRAENYLREFNAALEEQVNQRTAELSRLAGLLQAVLDASSEVSIIATDLQGKVIVFNRGAEQLLGYRAEDMIGRSDPGEFHLQAEVEARALELSREYGQPIQGVDVFHHKADLEGAETRQWTYVRKDGSHVQVSMVITPIRTASGDLIGHLGIAQDITERLHISAELQKSKAVAESANAAKSLFLANMSHEIRTPMNAVIGIAHLLQNTPLDEQQRQLLRKLQIAGRSLLGIINDILDIAKIEAGQMKLESSPFSPRQLLAELAELFAPQAESKGLSFSVQGAELLPDLLLGDALRVNQILMNLIGNALKFTAHGGIEVVVRCEQGEPAHCWLSFAVHDSGCGIAADVIGSLFTPFTQADTSTTRRFGGTGLGLSVVRGLTDQMGGSVAVRSEPGQGSEFCIRLPFRLAQAEWESDLASRSLEVLLGDGDDAGREHLLRLCSALGWRVEAVGAEAGLLDVLRTRLHLGSVLPDVLLVAGALPPRGGRQVLQRAAELLGSARLPGCLILPDDAQMLFARQEPWVDQVLHWPASSAELFNAVSAGVARRLGTSERVLQATLVETGAICWLDGLRLLLVDDSELNLEVASLLLVQQGAEVQSCRNGREALECLRLNPGHFDAVLMDVQMPEMDGYEATRRIRSELGLIRLPVLALTAGALAEERRQAEEAGMDDFLTKPLEPALLIRALRRAVEAVRGTLLQVRAIEQQKASMSQWPVIQGIDAQEAARNLGNDLTLFLSSLRHLHGEFAEFAELPLIERSLQRDPAHLAARVHKLRGSVGLLGARALHALATTVENLLRGDMQDPRLPELLAQLVGIYAELQRQITPHLGEALAPPRVEAGQAEAGEALKMLCIQLRQHDMAALEQFALAAPALQALAGQGLVEQLWHAIDALDYQQALTLLERAGLAER
ncbi:MAG: hybrid sensor histidine kinase/response regulator [Pseudomonas sp.]|nr:MAG: hybrid sensor histidine kinase/response regulator [Pseudomonas sp.]